MKRRRRYNADLERKEQEIRERNQPLCSNCGSPGRHFAPPSFGEPGFFTCSYLEEAKK